MSSHSPSPDPDLPPTAKHALEVLLRASDPRGGAELAEARDTFCHAIGTLRERGLTLSQVIVMIEAAARDVGAEPDAILAVVGLCADDFVQRRRSIR